MVTNDEVMDDIPPLSPGAEGFNGFEEEGVNDNPHNQPVVTGIFFRTVISFTCFDLLFF